MNLTKIHKISTRLAAATIFVAIAFFFIGTVDNMFRFDLVSPQWEPIIFLLASISGLIALGSTIMSAMLSLYRLAEKE